MVGGTKLNKSTELVTTMVKYGDNQLTVINSKDPLVPTSALSISLPDSDKKALAIAAEFALPCLLVGQTGTGKTSVIREIAFLKKQPYVRVNMTGFTTPDELIGSKSVKKGATYFEHGIITDAMNRGAILVIDEINATTPDCLFILHGLLDEDCRITLPNGDVIRPHKDFRVFATCNPDYEGTKTMNKAFLDRFPIILSIETLSPKEETRLIVDRTGASEDTANKLVLVATSARKAYLESKLSVYVSTRSLLSVANLAKNGLDLRTAYDVGISKKTNDIVEQKTLLDLFLAVFKMAGGKNTRKDAVITTKEEIDSLKEQAERGRIDQKELINVRAEYKDKLAFVQGERDGFEKNLRDTVNEKIKLEWKLENMRNELETYKRIDELLKKASKEGAV